MKALLVITLKDETRLDDLGFHFHDGRDGFCCLIPLLGGPLGNDR